MESENEADRTLQPEQREPKKRKKRILKLLLGIAVTALAVAGIYLTVYALELSPRRIFGTEEEMLAYLEGTWSNGEDAFSITGGKATVYYGASAIDNFVPVALYPDKGYFKLWHYTYIVLKNTETLNSRWETYDKTSDQAERPDLAHPEVKPVESAVEVLNIHDVKLEYGENYITCTGIITNEGEHTYYHILVKCDFETSDRTVVKTDRTYVVYQQGLEPGESKEFNAKVKWDDAIESVAARLDGYAYEKYQ
jgi:hypothetical protein